MELVSSAAGRQFSASEVAPSMEPRMSTTAVLRMCSAAIRMGSGIVSHLALVVEIETRSFAFAQDDGASSRSVPVLRMQHGHARTTRSRYMYCPPLGLNCWPV